MIRRCCVCKIEMGECPPLEDKSYTDGYCRKHELMTMMRDDLIEPAEAHELSEILYANLTAGTELLLDRLYE